MDFISNILKRPISLTSIDSVSLDEHNNMLPPSPLSTSPLQSNLIATAMNTAISASLAVNHPYVGEISGGSSSTTITEISYHSDKTVKAPSPGSKTSLFSHTHSSGSLSSMGSCSATSNTIGELLLEINDNLDRADFEDAESRSFGTTTSNSDPSTYRSAYVQLSPSLGGKSVDSRTSTPSGSTTASSPTPCGLNSSFNKLQASSDVSLSQSIDENGPPVNFMGLTKFNESEIPQLPGALDSKLEVELKSPYEGQLLCSASKKDCLNRNYLVGNSDFETPTSSDNEMFTECQAYFDDMNSIHNSPSDHFNDISEAEIYCSAVNSTNSTAVKPFDKDPLNLTLENMPGEPQSEKDQLLGTPAAKILKSRLSLLEQMQKAEDQLANSTLEDEPMDVDMNSTLNFSKNETLEADYILKQNKGNDSKLLNTSSDSTRTIAAEKHSTSLIVPQRSPVMASRAGGADLQEHSNEMTSKTPDNAVSAGKRSGVMIHQNTSPKPLNNKLTLDIAPPQSDARDSASTSPNFPLKPDGNKGCFPFSPTARKEKPHSVFLEKSDYAERANAENVNLFPPAAQAYLMPPSPNNSQSSPINTTMILNKTPNEESPMLNSGCAINNQTFRAASVASPIGNESVTTSLTTPITPNLNAPIEQGSFPITANRRRTFEISPNSISEQNPTPINTNNISGLLISYDNDSIKRRTFNISTLDADACSENMNNNTFNVNASSPAEIKRRTFNVVQNDAYPNAAANEDVLATETDSNSNKRRTFNMSSTETSRGGDNCEPMDIDASFTGVSVPPPNEDNFREPLPPPPVRKVQKRPSIHSGRGPVEVLSAKEQTKSNAKDEKDVAVENIARTLSEMMPQESFPNSNQAFDDDEFSGANLILNPSDFDYLLTKGNSNAQVARSSILLKFDPLLANQPHKQQQQLQQQLQQILENNASLAPAFEEGEQQGPDKNNSNRDLFLLVQAKDTHAKTDTNGSDKSKEHGLVANSLPKHSKLPASDSEGHATMSVDVIKDMNLDNDCNKTFENSNSHSDEKQSNFKMDGLEKKIKNEVLKTEDIEKKLKEAEQREEALIKRITEKDKTISKMNGVIEAYEKAIAELIAEKEQLIQSYEKQLAEIKADRDSNYHHLTSLETTFSDLHVKYEKSKEMTLQLKSSEDALLVEKRQNLENLRLQEQRYEKMKNHAMQQLEIANKKLESMKKEHTIETTKLKAQLKKEEISRCSITEQLQQKSRENEELVKICDELINGQGMPGNV